MTERQSPTPHWPGSTPPGIEEGNEDSTISLKPWWDLLLAYRFVIIATFVVIVLVTTAALFAAALALPAERTASLKIRLLFDGAADGLYPNGTTFSPAELTSTPVLTEVFRINDLQRFGTYDTFKDSMTVLHSSVEQDLLAAAYGSRLGDSKLTSVDRARLEDEFRKKRDAIKDPTYELSFRRSERLTAMPTALLEKILNDTAAVWARQADEVKGATHFNVPVFSRSVLTPDILKRDFLMTADTLRIQARRALDVCDQLLLVPGAATIRAGKDRASLTEVRFAISDSLRNQIEPVLYLIQERGISTDPQAAAQYLHGHVVELRLERDAARARIQNLQDALQGYQYSSTNRRDTAASAGTGAGKGASGLENQTVIPQLSDTFLNRLLEISEKSQASETEYRRRLSERIIKEGEALSELNRTTGYYEDLEHTVRVGGAPVSAAQSEGVRSDLQRAFDTMATSVERLAAIYEELSVQRLNPAVTLFAVTEPFSQRTSYALTRGMAIGIVALMLFLTLLVTPVACAWHASRRKVRLQVVQGATPTRTA